jgi:hypothetical protein
VYYSNNYTWACVDIPIPPPIVVNITKNVTVYEGTAPQLTGERLPLYGSIVIMLCIMAGVLLYFLTEWV